MEWEWVKLILTLCGCACIFLTFWLQNKDINYLKDKLKALTDSLPKDDKIITLSGLEYYNKRLKEELDQWYVKRKNSKRYYLLKAEWDKCEKCDTYNCGVHKYFYGTYKQARDELFELKRNALCHDINDISLSVKEITKKEYDKETKND